MKLDESSVIYLLWLIKGLGVGNYKINSLTDYYQTPEAIFLSPVSQLAKIGSLTVSEVDNLEKYRDLRECQQILDKCKEEEISICTIYDINYPERFKNIPNPPVLFFYKGSPVWDSAILNIGIVGTRKMDSYGKKVAESIACELSESGVMVVSGLAEGIDSAAQSAIIKTGGTTIAFLAGGVDVIYPNKNIVLYYDIIDSGCIISEFLPGEKNLPHHFQMRNRLIAGMCDGIIVIQAPLKSGAMITAKWAGEYGKELFAIPGDIDNPLCEGCNELILDGAKLTRNGFDVLCEFKYIFSEPIKEKKTEKLPVINTNEITNVNALQIISALKNGDIETTNLSEKTKISMEELIFLLTDLQIKGIITEKPGGFYSLNKGVII